MQSTNGVRVLEADLRGITRCFNEQHVLRPNGEYENGPPTPEPSGETIVRGRDRGKCKEAELYAPDPSYW